MKRRVILNVVFVLTVSAWVLIGAFVAIISIPHNPLSRFFSNRKTVLISKSVLPEGFSFFTRNPKEPTLHLYKLVAGKLQRLPQNNAHYKNAFGIIRKTRSENVELGSILSTLNGRKWGRCVNLSVDDCISSSVIIPKYTISNLNEEPQLCGDFVIQNVEAMPYAWNSFKKKIYMPYEIIEIKIICN